MRDIIDRQTFVICVDLFSLAVANGKAIIQSPMNLRFAADELILKSLMYNVVASTPDTDDAVQIWCNITNDNLLTAFPNNTAVLQYPDLHFKLSNTFQTGNLVLQFQQTASNPSFFYNPQPPIVDPVTGTSNTNGLLSITIEFIKYAK
jgi:hypothetical protein